MLIRFLAVYCALILAPGFAVAGPIRVVATGDSVTRQVVRTGSLGASLAAEDVPYRLEYVAYGGTTAPRYDALEINPYTDQYDDFVAMTLAYEPDVVTIMLGTNDAARANTTPDTFEQFTFAMTDILNRYQAAKVPVVLATPLPILRPGVKFDVARVALQEKFVPWIRAQDVRPNVFLVDVNARMLAIPNYISLYREVDLIHPNVEGYVWLADQWKSGIEAALKGDSIFHRAGTSGSVRYFDPSRGLVNNPMPTVPEPQSLSLAAVAVLCCFARKFPANHANHAKGRTNR